MTAGFLGLKLDSIRMAARFREDKLARIIFTLDSVYLRFTIHRWNFSDLRVSSISCHGQFLCVEHSAG